jgi:hypothetical protein
MLTSKGTIEQPEVNLTQEKTALNHADFTLKHVP